MKLWIARNKSGTLVLWFNKPVKQGEGWYNNDGFFILDSVQSPTFGEVTPFPEVTFENSPQMVEIKLIKEEQIMEITKSEIEKMANDYVNNENHKHYPGIEKSYLFEGYVEGIMEFCQKMNINVIV